MSYCSNCGQEIMEGAKFCPGCGTSIPNNHSDNIHRKQEYAGKVVKCPSCGEEITSFTAICPTCGHEFNSAKVSETLERFIQQINKCEEAIANSQMSVKSGWSSWNKSQRVWWVIFNILFACIPLVIYWVYPLITIKSTPKLSKEEKQLVSLIENFPFPNDRESILEALVYTKEKIDFISKEKIDRKSAYWMSLWCSKAEQLKQKADLMFPNDFIVKQSFEEILADKKRVNNTIKYKAIVGCVLFAITIIYMLTRNGTIDTTNYDVELKWQTNGLFLYLPEPEVNTGKIILESEKQVQVELYNVSIDEFDVYVEACREAGFTVDVTKNDGVFYAKNDEGYNLNLFYYVDKEVLNISLDSYNAKTMGDSSQ